MLSSAFDAVTNSLGTQYANLILLWESEVLAKYDLFWVATVGTFVVHQFLFFGICFPTWFAQFIPFFDRYRIQPDEPPTFKRQWKCLKLLLFSHTLVQIPMMMGSYHMFEMLGLGYSKPYPELASFLWKIPFCFLIEDAYHYVMHRAMHHTSVYMKVHNVHHEFHAPFGMTAEYAHPIETVVLGLGTALGPWFFCNHVFEFWAWIGARLIETVDVHSGYFFPWNPTRLIPFYGGARFHDMHHKERGCNFASTFTYLDRVFGTARFTSDDTLVESKLADAPVESKKTE